MLADHTIAGYGEPLDDALALEIPVVGFDGADEGGQFAAGPDVRRAAGLRRAGLRAAGWRAAASHHRDRVREALSRALLSRFQRLRPGAVLQALRRPPAIVLMAAVAISFGCWFGLRTVLAPHQRIAVQPAIVAVPAPPPAAQVLVARRAMPRGHVLDPHDLEWRPWPQGAASGPYITVGSRSLEALHGFVARVPLAEGEPINDAKIVSPGKHGFLTAALRPGMRAVSIPIASESAASGLIQPGDDVDILFTLPVPEIIYVGEGATTVNRHSSETVLNNIRVLAIDQNIDSHAGQSNLGSSATLEVTPKQAEIVALVDFMSLGKLSLSLRSLVPDGGEHAGGATAPLIDSDITKLFPAPAGPNNGPRQTVTIVRRDRAAVMPVDQPGS